MFGAEEYCGSSSVAKTGLGNFEALGAFVAWPGDSRYLVVSYLQLQDFLKHIRVFPLSPPFQHTLHNQPTPKRNYPPLHPLLAHHFQIRRFPSLPFNVLQTEPQDIKNFPPSPPLQHNLELTLLSNRRTSPSKPLCPIISNISFGAFRSTATK